MARLAAVLLALALAACAQSVGLPLDAQFPAVPQEVKACAKKKLTNGPQRDLTKAEAESFWKKDRVTAIAIQECLKELIVRDQKLAGQ